MTQAAVELLLRESLEREAVMRAALQRVLDYYDHGNISEFKAVTQQVQAALELAKGGA